jgi:hypothetical protein
MFPRRQKEMAFQHGAGFPQKFYRLFHGAIIYGRTGKLKGALPHEKSGEEGALPFALVPHPCYDPADENASSYLLRSLLGHVR